MPPGARVCGGRDAHGCSDSIGGVDRVGDVFLQVTWIVRRVSVTLERVAVPAAGRPTSCKAGMAPTVIVAVSASIPELGWSASVMLRPYRHRRVTGRMRRLRGANPDLRRAVRPREVPVRGLLSVSCESLDSMQ